MRFDADQQFRASPAQVMALYTDETFYDHLDSLDKIGQPKVLERIVDGSKVTMRVHYKMIAELPSAAQAVLDPSKLTWVEETVYDLDAATTRTVLHPDHYADRMTASLTGRFSPATGSSGGGTLRQLTGEIKIKMPLVGGRVERVIVGDFKTFLTDQARIADDLLGA